MKETPSINYQIWGVLSYLAQAFFFVVPFIRLVYRPFGCAR
jgi:hypothetical protein